jgi:hypothetical protein
MLSMKAKERFSFNERSEQTVEEWHGPSQIASTIRSARKCPDKHEDNRFCVEKALPFDEVMLGKHGMYFVSGAEKSQSTGLHHHSPLPLSLGAISQINVVVVASTTDSKAHTQSATPTTVETVPTTLTRLRQSRQRSHPAYARHSHWPKT